MILAVIKMSAHKILRRRRKLSALKRRRKLSAIKLSADKLSAKWIPVRVVSVETIIVLLLLEISIHIFEVALDIVQFFQ